MRLAIVVTSLLAIASSSQGTEIAIDRDILKKLNSGVLGCSTKIFEGYGTNRKKCGGKAGTPRVATEIVSLKAKVTKVDKWEVNDFDEVGSREDSATHFHFVNCGSATETRRYAVDVTTQRTTSVEMSNTVETTTTIKSGVTYDSGGLVNKIGGSLDVTHVKKLALFNKTSDSTVTTVKKSESFDLAAPSMTEVLYTIEVVGGKREIEFSGLLEVDGVYRYRIAHAYWDNVPIRRALTKSARTYPFAGTLTSWNYNRTNLAKFEVKLSPEECQAYAQQQNFVSIEELNDKQFARTQQRMRAQ